MVTVGIALIIITNVINNNERERIMHYLVRTEMDNSDFSFLTNPDLDQGQGFATIP
jgi:hypothetical protein